MATRAKGATGGSATPLPISQSQPVESNSEGGLPGGRSFFLDDQRGRVKRAYKQPLSLPAILLSCLAGNASQLHLTKLEFHSALPSNPFYVLSNQDNPPSFMHSYCIYEFSERHSCPSSAFFSNHIAPSMTYGALPCGEQLQINMFGTLHNFRFPIIV